MGLSHLSFLRDWKNPADFPTVEPDEATVRADLQYHPDAIKDYINGTLIPSHDSLTSAKHSHDNKTVLDGITADDVAKWRGTIGTFRVNVTYSNGAYSADKTFAEIKAAYDAGKQPYVVYGGDTIYTLSYCYFASEQMFMDFARYLIGEDTLETETLRIYSYTPDSGSNIVKRTEEFNVPNGTTYIAVDSTDDVISTVNGETYADIQALINAGKPVVVRFDDDLDFYYFETFGFSDSSGIHRQLNFRCVMGSIVYTLALKDDNTWAFSETSLQPSSITDTGGYFTTDTVEGALQEIGAGLVGAVKSVNGKTGAVVLNVEDINYAKESQKLDTIIDGLKATDIQMASDISELQTADASLGSRITAIETGDAPVTLYIYWASVAGGGHVSLTRNGTAMSVTDFISKMQSGAKIIIGENNDTDSASSGFTNYRYKITDPTTASLAFDVANSFNVSNRTIIISGSSSTNGLMSGYQDIGHDDLSDYSPLPEGSTPASKAWVENYVAEKAAALQSKTITDTGGYFTTDTVEGALQEIGAELAGVNTLLGSGIQISFTIDDGSEVNTFSVVSGTTFVEWIWPSRVISETSGLTLYTVADGPVVADEAGVYALSLDGSTAVYGSDEIVSGATYTIISYGG